MADCLAGNKVLAYDPAGKSTTLHRFDEPITTPPVRAHDTAIHLVEDVLPVAPYRQWTFSFPMRLRFLLARDSALMSEVLGVFVRALFCFQRKAARRLGVRKPFPGAVAFLRRFGSALQLTPPGGARGGAALLHPAWPRTAPRS